MAQRPPYEVAIQLDSLRQQGGSVPPDSLYRAEGTRWTGALGADGELTDLRPDRSSTIGDQVGATLPVLFPAFPLAGLEQGSAWTDTTRRSLKADAFDATERGGDELPRHGCRRPRDHDREQHDVRADRQGRPGGTADGDDRRRRSAGSLSVRAERGSAHGAEGADSAEIMISVPAVGQTVPVSQRATWRVERIGAP